MAKSIAKLSVSLTASTGKFTKGMQKSTKSTESFMNGLRRTTKMVGAFVAAGAAAAFGFMAMQIRKAAGAIDGLAKSAARLGTTAASLQFLRFQAGLFGISVEQMDKAMLNFTRRLGEATQGTGQAARALDILGLNAEDLIRMPLDERMETLRKALSGVSSTAERVNLAYQIMGRQGAMLVPMLTQQDAAAQSVRDRFEAMNITLSQADTSAVEAMNDSLSVLRMLIDAVWQRVTVALAPSIDAFAQRMEKASAQAEAVNTAARRILKVIAVGKAVISDLGRGLQALAVGAGLAFASVGHAVTWFIESIAIAANDLAQFTGIGQESAAAFLKTATAAREFTETLVTDSVSRLKMLAEEESAVLGLGDAFRQIDRSVENIGKGMEAVADETASAAADAEDLLSQMEAMERFADQIIKQTRTPLEIFEEQIKRLNEVFEKGLIDEETFRRAVEQAEKALADATATVGESAADPQTSDFRQVRLSQVALNGVRAVSPKPTEIFSPQIEELIALNRELVRGGAFARVAL